MPALAPEQLRMQARRLENQIGVLLAIPFEDEEKAEWLLPIVAWLSKKGKIELRVWFLYNSAKAYQRAVVAS